MTNRIVRTFFIVAAGALASCGKDDPVEPGIGPATKVIEVSPPATLRTGPANSVLGTAITVAVTDANDHPIAGQIVTFSIQAGGGSLTGNLVDTTDANGQATAPSWRLGKSADGAGSQKLRAASGALTPVDIGATVQTSYAISVRFFGTTTMSPAQQALFTNAAQRIMGVVTGDIANVTVQQDISECFGQAANTTMMNEVVDDVVVYAQAKAIDGPGQTLGSAGPCYLRGGVGCTTLGCKDLAIIGVMTFDIADLNGAGLQDVITHEMLHVLGVGSLWNPSYFDYLTGAGTLDPRYTAAEARAGCTSVGGTLSCASTVPVEGCADHPSCQPPNGGGTRDAHWREQTFGAELMTGFINNSNPFSSVTIGGLKDMGYVVNAGDNDAYTILVNAGMASIMAAPTATPFSAAWEGAHTVPIYRMGLDGKVTSVFRTGK